MNIFALSTDPEEAAVYHCDKHVVKMILEYSQILSTTHRHFGSTEEVLYKSTHVNHPSTVWARTTRENYLWLFELLKNLSKEYSYRYGKVHLSWTKLSDILQVPPRDLESKVLTPVSLAMPDYCKIENSHVDSYRKYYNKEKRHIAVWSKREIPEWYER